VQLARTVCKAEGRTVIDLRDGNSEK